MGKHFFSSSPNLKHICLLFFSESLFRWGCEEEMLRKVLNVLTCLFSTWWYSNLGKASKKTRIFYGQADRKGGGGSTPSGLTVAFVKNSTLFSYEI